MEYLEKGVSKHFLSDPEGTLAYGQDTLLEDIIFNFLRCERESDWTSSIGLEVASDNLA